MWCDHQRAIFCVVWRASQVLKLTVSACRGVSCLYILMELLDSFLSAVVVLRCSIGKFGVARGFIGKLWKLIADSRLK